MAIGNPVLLSSANEISAESIRPISFSRQDQSSFNETLLQEIVDLAPEILPIRDFYPAVTSVCSLGREIPLDLGGERQGFIDNLLITNDGHLVIVETKLYIPCFFGHFAGIYFEVYYARAKAKSKGYDAYQTVII